MSGETKSFDVFLSYSHEDAKWVKELAKKLEDDAKLRVWLDKWILIPGELWQQAMAHGLDEARSCVVCIGDKTPKGWFQQEIGRALNRQVKDPSFRVIPVLLPDALTVNVDDFLELRTWVDLRKGIEDKDAFHLLVCGIKGIPPGRGQEVRSGQSCIIPSILPEYPEKLREFVIKNRADELANALKYLKDHRILFISGIGGVGKTTLARALVENRPDDVPPPFWFDFGKNMDAKLENLLERLAAYLNAPHILRFKSDKKEAGQNDIDLLICELKMPLWLVFDNLETALSGKNFRDNGTDSLFTSFCGTGHGAKIIITSRNFPEFRNGDTLIDPAEDEEKQDIKGLRINDAIEFLKKSGLGNIKDEELTNLAESVDGHPLALKLFIGLVKKTSVTDILKDLSKFKKKKKETIKKTRMLFDRLAGDEKELLERISTYRLPEPVEAFKNMFTEKTSADAVEKLLDESLLETDHNGKYWLHPLVREFAYDDLKNKTGAHKRACEYYLSLQPPEKRSGIEDIQYLIEAYHHACEAKEFNWAADIIFGTKIHVDLDRWGKNRTLIELFSRLLPEDHFKGQPFLKNQQVHGEVLGSLGNAYRDLGQFDKAIHYYKQALDIACEVGDIRGKGARLGNMGLAYCYQGQFKEAIEYHEQALAIAYQIGDKYYEGNQIHNLGVAYNYLGQIEKAINYYEQALAIASEIGNRRGEAGCLGSLGVAYSNLGQFEKAIVYYEQALAIAHEIGAKGEEGNCLGNLGVVYSLVGQFEKAIVYYEQALAIDCKIGNRRIEGADLGNIGLAYNQLGQFDKAIGYYEKALTITREIGDKRSEGKHLGNLGLAYNDLGKVDKAIGYYEQALAIGKEIKDLSIINFCKENLGSMK